MKLNLPNIITLLRIAVSPVFFWFILSTDPMVQQFGCILFLIGALSDFIDGWYARKYNEVTNFGKFTDPLADKFLTTAAFLAFVFLNIIPLWMVLVIIFRDFGITFLRIYSEKFNLHFKTTFFAKFKTMLQMVFIAYILILLFIKNANTELKFIYNIHNLIYSDITFYTMLMITAVTIFTILEYILQLKQHSAKFDTIQ